MTREGIRPIGAFLIASLAALALVACGSSDSTTSGSTAAEATAPSSGQSVAKAGGTKNTQQGGSETKASGGSKSGGGSGSGPAEVATPLEISGGGSAQFRNKGGDNSIQEFGEESDESELEEAAEAVHSFYVARAEGDWSGACTYVAKSIVQQLEQLGEQTPQLKGKPCAVLLHAFTRSLSPAAARETTVVDAGSLRREGERSFLIYYGADKVAFAMPLAQEGGGWKVTLLSATPLG